MTHIILVHGAWHGGWVWRDVAARLRSHGHTVLTPTLTGLGERRHLLDASVGLALHTADLLSLLESEEVDDGILVGHSYGARPAALAAAHPGIRAFISLDGVGLEQGTSLVDNAPADQLKAIRATLVDGLAVAPFPPEAIGVPADHPLHAWVARRQTPMPWKSLTDRMPPLPARFHSIHRAYIRALGNTLDGPHEGAREALAAGWPLRDIASGHDLPVTAPAETATAILEMSSA